MNVQEKPSRKKKQQQKKGAKEKVKTSVWLSCALFDLIEPQIMSTAHALISGDFR